MDPAHLVTLRERKSFDWTGFIVFMSSLLKKMSFRKETAATVREERDHPLVMLETHLYCSPVFK